MVKVFSAFTYVLQPTVYISESVIVCRKVIQHEKNMKDHHATHDYDDDLDDDHDWGDPVQDLDLVNMSNDQYLRRILGPRRMGFEVEITS